LLEIQERERLIKPGQVIVDLGAAPGGWSQVARQLLGESGRVIAVDILAMEPIAGVEVVEGDFREAACLEQLRERLGERCVDLVISDMAPNVSGTAAVDQPRAMYLAELALDFARDFLKPGGSLAMKVFQGVGFEELVRDLRSAFTRVVTRKPKASRPASREVYLVAGSFRLV